MAAVPQLGSYLNLADAPRRIQGCRPGRHVSCVYAPGLDGKPEFFSLRPPENFEVRELAELLAKRISALLNVAASRRQAGDAEESDRLARDQPWLSEVYAASVCGRLATGPDSGPDRGWR